MGTQLDVLRQFGIGVESIKYTAVAPTNWFYRDDPFRLNPRVNHVQKRMGVGKAHSSYGVIQGAKWSEPGGSIYVDALGYLPILKMIHTTVATTGSDPYTHTGTQIGGKSATIAVDDADKGEERVAGFMLNTIKESYRMNEIIKVEINGNGKFPEDQSGAYTPASDLDVPLFIGEFVTVKFATNVAGLGAASAIEVQELDFEFNFGLSEAPSKTHSLGSRELTRNYGTRTSGKVTMKKFWINNTYKGYFEDADELAMQIIIENPDIDLGSGTHPSITRTFPKVSVNWNEDSDISDAQMESLEIDIHEGSDGSAQYPFKTVLVNDDSDA